VNNVKEESLPVL